MESERVVSRERGAQLAAEMKCHFFEASAKNKINVEAEFHNFIIIQLIN